MTGNDKNENQSFASYRRLIMTELKDLKEELRQLRKDHIRAIELLRSDTVQMVNDIYSKINRVNDSVITLKVKASLWGIAAGTLPGLLAAVIWWANQ